MHSVALMATLSLDKALSALLLIAEAFKHAIVSSRWVKLVGKLGHSLYLTRLDYTMMAGLHGPMQAGREVDRGPDEVIVLNKLMWRSLRRWADTLTSSPGVALSSLLPNSPSASMFEGLQFQGSSDASSDVNEAT